MHLKNVSTVYENVLEGAVIDTVDVFPCFLHPLRKEACPSCTEKLGLAAGCSVELPIQVTLLA